MSHLRLLPNYLPVATETLSDFHRLADAYLAQLPPEPTKEERYRIAYKNMAWSFAWFLLIPVLGWAAYVFILLLGPGEEM